MSDRSEKSMNRCFVAGMGRFLKTIVTTGSSKDHGL